VREAMTLCMHDASNAFRERLRSGLEDGEIDPVVDIDTALAIIMATGEGVAMSGLPGRDIAFGQIETAMRAMLEGLLRPRQTAASQSTVG
jgi:hypothetical protein